MIYVIFHLFMIKPLFCNRCFERTIEITSKNRISIEGRLHELDAQKED
jgi:hypothetical protein